MNLAQFTGFINEPEKLDGQSLPLLNELVKEYPYFQTAQTLLAKNLHNEKNIRYKAQLKIAAAYSADRKKLYELINGIKITEKVSPQIKVKESNSLLKEDIQEKAIPLQQTPEPKVEIIIKEEAPKLQPLEEKKKEERPEPVLRKKQLNELGKHTFSEWLRLASINSVTATEIEREKKLPTPKEDLIEKFIREDPKISKPKKTEFFSPAQMAKQSVIEDADLVSETLALIYEKQGSYSKAIKAYEKLSLKYPEKKLSFAARIENLRQKLNEQ